MYTDKVIFKGTPAQFYAVFEEFQLDVNRGLERIPKMFNVVDMTPSTARGYGFIPFSGEIHHRVTIVLAKIKEGEPRGITITAISIPKEKTQITCRTLDEDEFEQVSHIWDSLISYMVNLEYLEGEYEKLPEPDKWIEYLSNKGLYHSTDEWYKEVEKMTLRYWSERGKRKLSITKLAETLSVGRDDIYKKTTLRAWGESKKK